LSCYEISCRHAAGGLQESLTLIGFFKDRENRHGARSRKKISFSQMMYLELQFNGPSKTDLPLQKGTRCRCGIEGRSNKADPRARRPLQLSRNTRRRLAFERCYTACSRLHASLPVLWGPFQQLLRSQKSSRPKDLYEAQSHNCMEV